VAVIGITALTNTFWNAEAGYLLAAATMVSVWVLTHALLRGGRLHCPYRPS
jgi:hypothetical protein